MGTTLKEQYATSPLYGGNAAAMEALYEQYIADPDSVPAQGAHGVADIALGEDPEFMIRMQVTIRHVHDGLIGMHTDSLDLDDAARLKRLVELNIADPALLQREMEELSAF